MSRRGTLHLLLGPVGAGKSTYARRQLAQTPAVFLDLDAWMVRLFGQDPRPEENVMAWYLERRERCRAVMWDVATGVLEGATDVYLELGLLTAAEREQAYARARVEGWALRVIVVEAPRDVRRARVLARNEQNAPFTQIVPSALFERASDAWESPSDKERVAYGIMEV
jgi:predicted kinase